MAEKVVKTETLVHNLNVETSDNHENHVNIEPESPSTTTNQFQNNYNTNSASPDRLMLERLGSMLPVEVQLTNCSGSNRFTYVEGSERRLPDNEVAHLNEIHAHLGYPKYFISRKIIIMACQTDVADIFEDDEEVENYDGSDDDDDSDNGFDDDEEHGYSKFNFNTSDCIRDDEQLKFSDEILIEENNECNHLDINKIKNENNDDEFMQNSDSTGNSDLIKFEELPQDNFDIDKIKIEKVDIDENTQTDDIENTDLKDDISKEKILLNEVEIEKDSDEDSIESQPLKEEINSDDDEEDRDPN